MGKTKRIVLGEEPKEKKLKPIVFIKCHPCEDTASIKDPEYGPSHFDVIELVRRSKSQHHYDVMFAYDGDRNPGCIYMGHWNDGVIE